MILIELAPAWTADDGRVECRAAAISDKEFGRNAMARSPKDIPTSIEEVTPDDQTSGGIEPDEEAVRQLAYEIWEREGKQPDRDQEYWQRAKELLRARPA
jgi:hypothetical protein